MDQRSEFSELHYRNIEKPCYKCHHCYVTRRICKRTGRVAAFSCDEWISHEEYKIENKSW